MTKPEDFVPSSSKAAWTKPDFEVVATPSQVTSAVNIDDDEDFYGVPGPS